MPASDDRFARQNRCGLPPEFPLASPYSGIVHHLSGRNSNALTRIQPREGGSGSVDDAPDPALPREEGPDRLSPRRAPGPAFTFTALSGGFPPPRGSRTCCTPWSVFQDGSSAAASWPGRPGARRGKCTDRRAPTRPHRALRAVPRRAGGGGRTGPGLSRERGRPAPLGWKGRPPLSSVPRGPDSATTAVSSPAPSSPPEGGAEPASPPRRR